MSEIALIWVGRRASLETEALAEDYKARLARYLPFVEQRVRPAAGRASDRRRALAEEATAVQRHLRPGDTVVVLDERGREQTTEELAGWLASHRRRGRTVFVIGSDLGLDAEFKLRAHELLALSRLTLPHQLARLLLLEQLYRCCDWLAGGAYHRESVG